MLFSQVIGQDAIKRQLRLSAREGRIPHAQLLAGKAGIGKLHLALAYAQYLTTLFLIDQALLCLHS